VSINIKIEAAYLISILTLSNQTEKLNILISHNIFYYLIPHISGSQPVLSEHILNSLANIISSENSCREKLLEFGILTILEELFNKKYLSGNLYKSCIFLTANIFGAGPIIPFSKVFF